MWGRNCTRDKIDRMQFIRKSLKKILIKIKTQKRSFYKQTKKATDWGQGPGVTVTLKTKSK